jgi:cell division protein FtsI (penicillin-binding protein 3)
MGHEVSVTSLQLAVAGAVIANGGLKVKPRLVIARQRPGQPMQHITPEQPVRILRPETAITMRQMMEGVVLRGTGRGLANLKGYTSGGKTGSAQIYDAKAHVYTHNYNASFLGFAPVANPQIVIAVTLNHTTAPPALAVWRTCFPAKSRGRAAMLDVPKDLPEGAWRRGRPRSHAIPPTISPIRLVCSPSLDNDLYPPSLRRRFGRAPPLRLKLPHRTGGLFSTKNRSRC